MKSSTLKGFIQITTLDVFLLNEIDFPFAPILFESSFSMNRFADILEHFVVHEHLHTVFFRETGDKALSVFPDTPSEAVCDADIERAISLARENINEIGLRHRRRVTWVAR